MLVGLLVPSSPVPAEDQIILSWGANSSGQCTTMTGSFTGIAAGGILGWGHSAAVRSDGELLLWGNNGNGQLLAPAGPFIQVATGGYHTLGMRPDGTVIGWGYGGDGQTSVPDGERFQFMAAAHRLSMGLTLDGRILAWGSNSHGQQATPTGLFKGVACGALHGVGLSLDGSTMGWGDTTYGETQPQVGPYVAIAAGGVHAVGLRADGQIDGWGYNLDGRCTAPSDVRFRAVAAGDRHTIGLRTDGRVMAWGENGDGQCNVPNGRFDRIAGGYFYTMAMRNSRDCDGSGTDDLIEIRSGARIDLDGGGIPDRCQGATEIDLLSPSLGAPMPSVTLSHRFEGLIPSDGDVQLAITVRGDFDQADEYLEVRIAGQPMGRIMDGTFNTCVWQAPVTVPVIVPAAIFNAAVANGGLLVELQPTPTVDSTGCSRADVNMRLHYVTLTDPMGDCDGDGMLDARQIGLGLATDINGNDRPDHCDRALGDLDLSGEVDAADIGELLLLFDRTDAPFGDLDGDGLITAADLGALLSRFGPVP